MKKKELIKLISQFDDDVDFCIPAGDGGYHLIKIATELTEIEDKGSATDTWEGQYQDYMYDSGYYDHYPRELWNERPDKVRIIVLETLLQGDETRDSRQESNSYSVRLEDGSRVFRQGG